MDVQVLCFKMSVILCSRPRLELGGRQGMGKLGIQWVAGSGRNAQGKRHLLTNA
jgi:hypothetical protein